MTTKLSFSKLQTEAINIIKSRKNLPRKAYSSKNENFYFLFHEIDAKVLVSIIGQYQHTPSHYKEVFKRVEFTYNLHKKR